MPELTEDERRDICCFIPELHIRKVFEQVSSSGKQKSVDICVFELIETIDNCHPIKDAFLKERIKIFSRT